MPALIGLDQLHYALLADNGDNVTTGTASYGTPVAITGAISADINPNTSVDTIFADNGPADTATALGQISMELSVIDFPPQVQAAMLGHQYVSGALVKKGTDVPPWLAIGGRALKSNGAYRYFWIVKGKFADPEEKNQTKQDKVTFGTPTMKGNFVRRDCDGIWIIEYDTDSPDYNSSVEAAWFTKVIDLSDLPLGCYAIPVNGEQGVAVNSSITVVFTKAITTAVATTTNFVLMAQGGSTAVTCTVTLASDNKTVTVDPTANLTAATQYTLTVKAATGLPADKTFTFKTA